MKRRKTWLRILSSMHTRNFKTDSELSFKPWLYRIATNNALQYNRRRKIISFISFPICPKTSPVLKESVEFEDNLLSRQTLAKIPYDQRFVWCCIMSKVSSIEITEILGITKKLSASGLPGDKQFQVLYGRAGEMRCFDYEELLSAYAAMSFPVHGEFIEEHLAVCADCRDALAGFKSVRQRRRLRRSWSKSRI